MVLKELESPRKESMGNNLDFFAKAIERYGQMESTLDSGRETDNMGSSNRLVSESEENIGKNAPLKLSSTSISSDSIENEGHLDSDVDKGGETGIQKKRKASRVSSRRTRERERLRFCHYNEKKLKLTEDNECLEKENFLLRGVIAKVKAAAAANKHPEVSGGTATAIQERNDHEQAASALQSQQALAGVLLNALGPPHAQQNLPHFQVPTVTSPQPQAGLVHIQQILSLLQVISTHPPLFNLLVQLANMVQQQEVPIPPAIPFMSTLSSLAQPLQQTQPIPAQQQGQQNLRQEEVEKLLQLLPGDVLLQMQHRLNHNQQRGPTATPSSQESQPKSQQDVTPLQTNPTASQILQESLFQSLASHPKVLGTQSGSLQTQQQPGQHSTSSQPSVLTNSSLQQQQHLLNLLLSGGTKQPQPQPN